MSAFAPEPPPIEDLDQLPGDDRHTLHCDVVVVGSGAGGGAAAAALAEAGLTVTIVEEGGHHDTEAYSADVLQMMGRILRDGGSTFIAGKAPIPYLEGCCVGGTTVVNGGMCWRTPEKILDGWVQDFGLEQLSPEAMSPLFDEVEATINARQQDPGSQGGNNEVFRQGAERKGWRLSVNRRNQVHCVGSNECVSGCPSGAKQSSLQSWLPRAGRAGARVLAHSKVEKVLIEGGRAAGVMGRSRWRKRPFTIKARAVVMACGAVHTPVALLKNKIGRRSGQVGRHFTCHPNVKLFARFDTPVDSARGTHQAYQCTEFESEGILLAPGSLPLPFMSMIFSHDFGESLEARLEAQRYMFLGGILVEDSSAGRISTLMGQPRVRYDVQPLDQQRFIRGVCMFAEMLFDVGAREVYTPFFHMPVLKSPDDIARLKALEPKVKDTEYFTAHLMGSCRMHSDPRQGVVGPDGQCFDLPGLYLADASVMPGPVGVNPQVTIMALSLLIARQVAEALA
ncbi:MAG: GMC family oxidoreductase N-terminal domain-containing protein [Bradymonadia bacterium]